MVAKTTIRVLCILFILMFSACDLPEVTPPVEDTASPTTSFITTPQASDTAPSTPQTTAVTISDNNINNLVVAQKVPISNPQRVDWTNDSQSFSVVTQTTDSGGAELFGVTTLDVPSLATRYVYSVKDSRIPSVAADGRTAAVISADWLSYSLVDLGAGNTVIASGTPGFRIANVTFSTDLKYTAVTQAEAWEVVLYSFVNNSEIRRLTGFETAAPIFDAGFSASPVWMLWFARGTAQLQNVENGGLSAKFNHEDFLTSFTLSPDSTLLATAAGKTVNGTFSPVIILWDAAQGLELRTIVLSSTASALSFSPNGRLLAVGMEDTLQIWRVSDGVLLRTFPGHQSAVTLVKFSPDGKSIVTAGYDNQLYLWQVHQ
jgi:dipeptidyl aminopeptidase/acylaminoacyl peptidase